jgi:hypothetical protein
MAGLKTSFSPEKQYTPGILNTNGSNNSTELVTTKPGKKFMNGWTKELQDLAAEWVDHAACYEYMYEQCSQFLYQVNLGFKIPIIILSFLTGSTNIGLAGFFDNDEFSQKRAQWVIGGIGIIVGILGALDIFFKFGQESEAHHTARINWGNFHRNISFQLKLHPNERLDAISFMKMMQNEMSRLIVQSPKILQSIINSFKVKMKESTVKKPPIVAGLNHIIVFDDKESRLVKLFEEVNHLIKRKRGLMKDLVINELEERLKEKTIETIQTTLGTIQTPKEAFFRDELDALKHEISLLKNNQSSTKEQLPNIISLVPNEKNDFESLTIKPAETIVIN